jgi:hypothetical protein
MRIPSRHTAASINQWSCQTELKGKWVLARPEPFYDWKERFKLAFAVFTGKADALFWDGGQ